VRAAARVERLLRENAPRVLGALVRRYGHFDAAEDSTQEALLAAAQQWPEGGIPDDPLAWLLTVASRRLIDRLRSDEALRRREETVAARTRDEADPDPATGADADDTLTLLFLCSSCCRRADDGGNRTRLPGPRGHDGPARQPREAAGPAGGRDVHRS